MTDLENELLVAEGVVVVVVVVGKMEGKGVWDGHVHTVVFEMDNHQEPTV